MNSGRFFLPNASVHFSPFMRTSYLPNGGGMGFFGKLATSIKRFNWSGLLNGANKTLNVVNQSIPLVRQAGPMVNNMKNMFKIARAFGNETTTKRNVNSTSNNRNHQYNHTNNSTMIIEKKEVTNNNYPNFFV